MRAEFFYDVLGGIDLKYVDEAENYAKPKRLRNFALIAACACLAVVMIVTMPYFDNETSGSLPEEMQDISDGAPLYNEEPGDSTEGCHVSNDSSELGSSAGSASDGYRIVITERFEEYEDTAPLYAATVPNNELDEYVSAEFGREMHGLTLFDTDGDIAEGAPIWYPVMSGGSVSVIYWYSDNEDGTPSRGYSDGNEVEAALNSLAHLTSAEQPMYLVRENETVFAVIGDKAYLLPTFVFTPQEDTLAQIEFTSQAEVVCIE